MADKTEKVTPAGVRNDTGKVQRRRALAAAPTSLVLYFFTLLFSGAGATQMLRGDDAAVLLLGSFTTVIIATIVVIIAIFAFCLTLGSRLDIATQRFPTVVAALIFGGVGAGIGLVSSVALLSAITLVEGVASGQAFVALLLVLCVPAAVSGFGTRLVVGASSESLTELVVAFAMATISVALFWWSVRGYYIDSIF